MTNADTNAYSEANISTKRKQRATQIKVMRTDPAKINRNKVICIYISIVPSAIINFNPESAVMANFNCMIRVGVGSW